MKQYFTLFILCIFAHTFISGQSSKITGNVIDGTGSPLEFSNVIVYNVADSSMAKADVTGENGTFDLRGLSAGDYWLNISYLGFDDFNSSVFSLSDDATKSFDNINLEENTNTLDEVTITAKKPLLELKPDRTVFNVEGSINSSGSDAFALLRKSPGLVVDNNDNIYMMGKSGVRIFIDGRPSPLEGSDLADFLRNIASEEIDAIEIIHTPGAKYEAEGNAGIINIKFKKSNKKGANGTITSSTRQGKKFGQNLSFTGNFKQGNFNGYTTLSGYHGEGYNYHSFFREQYGGQYDLDGVGEGKWDGGNYRVGVDYSLSKKHTVGVLVSGMANTGEWNQNSETLISAIGATSLDSILRAKSLSDWDRNNLNLNANYRFDNGNGQSLNIDVDRGNYNSDGDENQPNVYFTPDGNQVLSENIFHTVTPKDIDITTGKLDYSINKGANTIEAGTKVTEVATDNVFKFFDVIDNEDVPNSDFSNEFKYNEMVYAGYANYKRKVSEKVNMNAGIRVEHTKSKGELFTLGTEQNGDVSERSYTDYFPSLGVSWAFNPKNSLNITYARRLSRPDYKVLNPFQSRIDEQTYEQGNKDLTPEYSNNISITHSYNYKLNTTLSYTKTTDLISRLTGTIDEPGRQDESFITWDNIDEQDAYSLNLASPLPIKKWWNSYSSVTAIHTRNQGFVRDNTIDIIVTSVNVYSQHTFTLPEGFSMELSGWYASPSIWGGTFKTDDMWSVDWGIQKAILNDKLKLKLNLTDLFLSNKWSGHNDFDDSIMIANGGWDSRRVSLNISYSFGNDKIKVKSRKTGLEDEAKRISEDNG